MDGQKLIGCRCAQTEDGVEDEDKRERASANKFLDRCRHRSMFPRLRTLLANDARRVQLDFRLRILFELVPRAE